MMLMDVFLECLDVDIFLEVLLMNNVCILDIFSKIDVDIIEKICVVNVVLEF